MHGEVSDVRRYHFATRNVLDKLRKVITTRGTAKFYLETYILSRVVRVEPDVYIVSYPKCGRTWVRTMLQKSAELLAQPEHRFYDKGLVQIADRIVKFEHDQGNWVPAPPRLHTLSFRQRKYAGKKVVFLVRDPRDVLVSSWYHLRYREHIYQTELPTFIRDELVGVEKIVSFMNMFVENKDVPSNFLLMTYEDLHGKPRESFRSLMQFMGIELDGDMLDQAIEASSFDRMRKMETRGAMREPWMRPGAKNLDKALKVRKGKVGSYLEELSESDIAYLDEVIRAKLHPSLPYRAGG